MAEVQLYKRGTGNNIIQGVDGTADSARLLSLGLGVTAPSVGLQIESGPIVVADASGDSAYIELSDGGSAGTSSAGDSRIRHEPTNDRLEASEDGGAYKALVNESASFYDTTGGQTFTTVITVNLDTTQSNSDTVLYTLSADAVTVAEAGTYLVAYDVSTATNGNQRTGTTTWLEVNSAEVSGTRAYCYNRNTTTGDDTASATMVLSLSASDVLRVRADVQSGPSTLATIADGSRLSIVRLT